MAQQLAKTMEEMRDEIKKLFLVMVDLKKEVEEVKIAYGKPQRIVIPSSLEMGSSSSDWATISEEAILGIDQFPLILPTNTARETLVSTIKALRDNPKGATAEEVSKITGRARNTESAYLRRLHLAGKVEKIKTGKKVKYRLP